MIEPDTTPEVPGARTRWVGRACVYLPVVAATGLCLYFARHVGAMPTWDYWYDLGHLLTAHGIHLTWQGVYSPSNENIIAIPQLIYAANVVLTHGDNRVLAWVTCVMSLGVGLLLASALARTLRSAPARLSSVVLVVFGCVAAVAAFTPMSPFNFFVGMSGVQWAGANLLVVAGLYVQCRHPASRRALAAAVALCLLSTQFYSTGIPALLLLGIQNLLHGRTHRRALALMAAGVAIIPIIYFTVSAGALAAPVFAPLTLAWFATVFLGGGLTPDLNLAGAWGAIGLLLFAWLFVRALWRRRALEPLQAFWACVGGYAFVAGVMAAAGRAVLGSYVALEDRYAIVPALFWVALLGLYLSQRDGDTGLAHARRVPVATVTAAIVAITLVVDGIPRIQHQLSLVPLKRAGALSVYLGARDERMLYRSLIIRIPILTNLRPRLMASHHIPFNGYFDRCPALGDSITVPGANPPGAPKGFLDGATPLAGGLFIKLRGWVAKGDDSSYAPITHKPRCIAIADAAGKIRGLGVSGLPRDDVKAALHTRGADFGWIAYVPRANPGEILSAYAQDASNGRWYPLHHRLTVASGTLTVQ